MIIEKIKERFDKAKNGILLFFDAEKEYEEELLSYQGEDFRVLLVDENYFRIKYEIEYKKKSEEKILVYHRFAAPKDREGYMEYPLANLFFAGALLEIDEIAEMMNNYGISLHHKVFIQNLQKWIKPKKYQSQLLPLLSQKPFDEEALARGVVSLILEEKKVGANNYNAIRVFELMNEGEERWIAKQKILQNLGLEQVLLRQLNYLFSIDVGDISYPSLRSLFLQLKYNAIMIHIPETKSGDSYAKLKLYDYAMQTRITCFFRDWQDDKNKSKTMEEVLENLGMEVQLDKIIQVYGVEEEYGLMTDQILEKKLYAAQNNIQISPDEIIERYSSWQNNAEDYMGQEKQVEFILNTALFYKLKKSYSDFIFNTADDYLSLYSGELYLLDYHYRKAFISYKEMKEEEKEHYYETFKELNKVYDQYLIDLNTPWVKEMDKHQFSIKELNIAKQYDFYKDFIASSQKKKVVIISDAFRYELAKDLVDMMSPDIHNQITCTAMLSAMPSYTNLGMSNLLPNDGIKAEISEGNIDYSIYNIKTTSSNRGKILHKAEPSSAVIDFATLSKLSRDEGRDFFRDKQIVYVYHNWMDAIGDRKVSEYYTFESSQQCITQLYNIVKKLYNTFNIGQVFITADHGFLFNYKEISEATSQPFPEMEHILKEHTRFAIVKDDFTPHDTYRFPLANTTNIETDAQVVIPKTINRFQKKGNFGMQFVHGGVSLQEIIVPVLEVKRVSGSNAEEVPFVRIDKNSTITSSIVKLKFLQSEPVGEIYRPHYITLGIYDVDGELLSSEVNVEFSQTSNSPTERNYEIRLEMLQRASQHKIGFLRAYKFKDKEKLNVIFNDTMRINILELDDF